MYLESMTTYLVFILSTRSFRLGPYYKWGRESQQDPFKGGINLWRDDLKTILKLQHFVSVTSKLLSQAFPKLKNCHAGVKHQVEWKSSAEGADADSEVCRNLRSTLWNVLCDVNSFTFFDKERKTTTIAWVWAFRVKLFIFNLFHFYIQVIDSLSCSLNHSQHCKPHSMMRMEVV